MRRLIIFSRLGRRNLIIAGLAAVALVASVIAYFTLPGSSPGSICPGGQAPLYWYDPMIPAERHSGPGKSSMGMETIPQCAGAVSEGGVTVSPAMQQNLGIRLASVETRDIAPTIRAVATVAFDDRQLYEVQTLTPGFVESLSVRAEGEPIGAGRVVAQVYSPDLLAAESEYRALLTDGSAAAQSLRAAARSRLRLLGAPEALVRRIERGGAPQRIYPVVSRSSGVVTHIGARPGAQVSLGDSIATIQGLSPILAVADVPEALLAGVHRGQPAEIAFPAYPGDIRKGTVDYIYPSLNTQSRTARVRITLPNTDDRLKAGQFANVTLQGTGGRAVVVPTEAVIDTGTRKVMIVRRDNAFVPVEVTTGRDVAEYTQILSGVRPGEQVVASGQFLIDSEASLSGVITRLQANLPTAHKTATGHGIVQSIDAANAKVTIKHKPIPEFDWPALTTSFKVAKPSLLRSLVRGSKVQFTVQARDEGPVIEAIRLESAQ